MILEKLIQYEAVHQIQGGTICGGAWKRTADAMHSSTRRLPDEPIIFIEVALTPELSAHVQALLDPDSPVLDTESAEWAIFYSITNCQQGLRGVPFGSFLIKQVVEDLSQGISAHPQIRHGFPGARLSPLAGREGGRLRTNRPSSRRTRTCWRRLTEPAWSAGRISAPGT